MNLSNLSKIGIRPAKRVGRGYGSGKGGHTTGRGSKGQKARGKPALSFEGTKIKKSLLKRLPMWRGKGKFKPDKAKYLAVGVSNLADWSEKLPVTVENLVKKGVIREGETRIKIVGPGEVKSGLVWEVAVTGSLKKKIEKAGGKIQKVDE